MEKQPVKPLDQVRSKICLKHYSIRTEQAYIGWIKRFIFFHNKQHPRDLGKIHIEQFLSHLAVEGNVAASTQNQAFNALLFLYRDVMGIEFPSNINSLRAKQPQRMPTVLTRNEVFEIINAMSGVFQLVVKVLYGCGMRGIESVRLRVQDIDFGMNQIMIRNAKGQKDRVTMLPETIAENLKEHLEYVNTLHKKDLADGFGSVYLPNALSRKYKNAEKSWIWQYVFPSNRLSIDPRSGITRRQHNNDLYPCSQ